MCTLHCKTLSIQNTLLLRRYSHFFFFGATHSHWSTGSKGQFDWNAYP